MSAQILLFPGVSPRDVRPGPADPDLPDGAKALVISQTLDGFTVAMKPATNSADQASIWA